MGHGVHEQHLAERRAPAGPALQVERGGHVHEREAHELGEAAGLGLQVGCAGCGGPTIGDSTAPNMIVTFDRSPTECATRWHSSHSSVVILSGHRISRIIVEDLGRRAGQRPQAGVHQPAQVGVERLAQALGALGDLQGGEAVHGMSGTAAFTALATST